MKFIWTFLLLFFTAVSQGESLVLEELYGKWESFKKSGKVTSFGQSETKQTMKLLFGDSFKKNDHIRQVKILSAKLEDNKLKVTVLFPQIILDISEVAVDENSPYKLVSRVSKLPVDPKKSYELELYGVHSVQTSDGTVVKKEAAKVFAKMKLISGPEWLAQLKAKLEVEDSSSDKFKKFLLSEVPSFKADSLSYEELGAKLKKTFKENGFDLIVMPGNEDPDNIERFTMSLEKAPLIEVVQRFAAFKELKYRLGLKEAIVATPAAFKKSKSIRSKDGLDLPGLKVDVKNKRMILDAKVCLSDGILEYLMCLPNSFEHESVFMTKVKPELIHMGLLLVQAEQMSYKGRSEIMKKLKDNKSRLKILVQWQKDNETVSVDLNKLLIDRSNQDKKTAAEDLWFFAGSYFTERNVYAANIHQSVISLQQHPASVIHYGKVTADPYRSGRGGFEVNGKLCPPIDSEVKLIFSLHP